MILQFSVPKLYHLFVRLFFALTVLSFDFTGKPTKGILLVYAWGSVGHRVVANLALSYVSNESKAKLQKYNKAMNVSSLVDIADWADSFSRQYVNNWSVDCHFLECTSNHESEEQCYQEWERNCLNGCCVTNAIKNYTAILRDPYHDTEYGYHVSPNKIQNVYNGKLSIYDFTADSLKFLVHYIGDIHQPFHVSFSDNSGGNYVKVQFLNESTVMHRLWDTDLITYWEINNGGCIEKDPIYKNECNGWKQLSEYIQNSVLSGQRGQDNIDNWRKVTNPIDWAKESHQLVQEAYKDYSFSIGKEYYYAHIDTLFEQLAKAAIRLAAILDTIFVEK